MVRILLEVSGQEADAVAANLVVAASDPPFTAILVILVVLLDGIEAASAARPLARSAPAKTRQADPGAVATGSLVVAFLAGEGARA